MLLINCEINLTLTWSPTYVSTNWTGAGTFSTTDTKLYVSVITLPTQDNTKLLEQLKNSGFKRTINWNKYQIIFAFSSFYSCRDYELCNVIKNLCCNCKN